MDSWSSEHYKQDEGTRRLPMTGTATPSLERDARGGVLVVGGYGQVGSRAARRLLAAGYRVVLAGRSASRAAAVASELGCDHARIDVIDERTWGPASEDAATVLCCVDQTDETFVRWVLGSGRDYVDITANDDFFRRVERLGADAEQGRATALLSVGLAPGLTNLMVKRLADPLEVREEAVIAVRLGLGNDTETSPSSGRCGSWRRARAGKRSRASSSRERSRPRLRSRSTSPTST